MWVYVFMRLLAYIVSLLGTCQFISVGIEMHTIAMVRV